MEEEENKIKLLGLDFKKKCYKSKLVFFYHNLHVNSISSVWNVVQKKGLQNAINLCKKKLN